MDPEKDLADGGGKDDMVKVSQWIKNEQEVMEREGRLQGDAVQVPPVAEAAEVEEEGGDIFGSRGLRLKRPRED